MLTTELPLHRMFLDHFPSVYEARLTALRAAAGLQPLRERGQGGATKEGSQGAKWQGAGG